VGGGTRHPGGAALDHCGARAHRPWRARVQGAWASRPWASRSWASRAAGLHQPTHCRPLRSILEAILGALSLSACGDRAGSTRLCPTLATDRCHTCAPVILVLLRRVPGLLPICPTVPRGMEAGNSHATIERIYTSPRDRGGGVSGVGCPRTARARREPSRHGFSALRLTQAALSPLHSRRPEGRILPSHVERPVGTLSPRIGMDRCSLTYAAFG
jgi:hypothetical protein